MSAIESFQATLTDRLLGDPIAPGFRNEADLEKRFVLPIVYGVHQQFPSLHVHAHPWRQKTTCRPNCSDGTGLISAPQIHGCPECWETSKSWAAVRLYGLHCFDVVVGRQRASLVVELKYYGARVRATGRPTTASSVWLANARSLGSYAHEW